MIDITIMSLFEADRTLHRDQNSDFPFVISLGDPDSRPPGNLYAEERVVLRLEFWDVDYEFLDGQIIPPSRDHIDQIITFGRQIINSEGRLLIHCHAGISRSTAAALTMFYLMYQDESLAGNALIAERPRALPNKLMIRYADEILSSNLGEITQEIYADRNERILSKIQPVDFPVDLPDAL